MSQLLANLQRVQRPCLALVAALATGAGCESYRACDPVPEVVAARLPSRLSETGLYRDLARDVLADGVVAYAPRFALWSDGALKRRWFSLPAGRTIDTRDMNNWDFPEGTRLWKEFTRDGVRVETRAMVKTGPGRSDWAFMAYVWNSAGTDADAVPAGLVDARGTPHDVPAAAQCTGCHGGRASRALGFSAVQLAGDVSAERPVTLRSLAAQGLLSDPPATDPVVPGAEIEQRALGYLHANCGHCHNAERPPSSGARCFDPANSLQFWLRVEDLAGVSSTATYRTVVGHEITPGSPDRSGVVRLVSRRDGWVWMPPLATERVDDEAVALLRAWITAM